MIAEHGLVGIEIAEFQITDKVEDDQVSLAALLDALSPFLGSIQF